MPDRLIVTEENQLKEVSVPEFPPQPAWIRVIAKIISYVFHPLFIPVYITYFIFRFRAYEFAGLDPRRNMLTLVLIIITCTLMPLVSVLLLRALNFVDSIYLKTQKDRIIPYIISMTFYFSVWVYFKKNHFETDLVRMALAIFNASVAGFLLNIIMKVSMHAIAMGVMTAFIAFLAFGETVNLSLYVTIALLISGIVCTARLIVSDHRPKEIYIGFMAGVLSQLAAEYFVSS
ncbi:MAG TPA: hypothetical protein VFP97_16495 [Chitinophagaceae bacterium]|nr:hypothetical protein [Chitinophagaceae bacterium]